jgi:uncharacterized protein
VLLSVLLTVFGGAVAGTLGAMFGIGGGVFLVPFLNLGLGLPMKAASGISLITVIATSSATSAAPGRLRLVNLRLGMVLEVFTTVGGLVGVSLVHRFSDVALQWAFGGVLLVVSVVMITRINVRNVITDLSIDVGPLGGRYFDVDRGADVVYRVTRLPVACLVSFMAGIVSMLGIGGGIVKVPALVAWCGVPIRVAAATSALMIAATAVVGAISYFMRGDVVLHLAAAAVLGVLAGSRLGASIASNTSTARLKFQMVILLVIIGLLYFWRAGR